MDLTEKAKQIINKFFYITIATVDDKGQPWNTPVYSAFDEEYNFYWISDQSGQHSKNISDNEKIFIVIYDSTAPEGAGEGVYVLAKAQMLTDKEEIANGLRFLDGRVGKQKDSQARVLEFMGENPRRVYKATPEKFWMNADGDTDGKYIDIRVEVKLK